MNTILFAVILQVGWLQDCHIIDKTLEICVQRLPLLLDLKLAQLAGGVL